MNQKPTHVHLVGIGGAGLSAIATVLLFQGYIVSGSDIQASETTERLKHLGATITIGHAAKNITEPNLDSASRGSPSDDVVVISSAIPPDNPEVVEASRRNILIQKRPAWIGQMMTGKRGIAIAGTHGKTTTTAMVALVLTEAELSPTYIVGGFIPQLNSNAAAGQSDLFIIEADEYDRTFLSLKPEVAVITNVDWDHPDSYPTEATYYQAFAAFAKLIPPQGQLILCGDHPISQKLSQGFPQAITYGLQAENTWQAVDLQLNEAGGYSFHVQERGQIITTQPVTLKIPGQYNVQNALAAIVVAATIGVPPDKSGQTLSTFQGTGRRFEVKGEINGITIVDDYAHHPVEIKATLAAARARFGERAIWAVFQPHTFSRTKLLLPDFAAAFNEADHAIILDIFSSAREKDDGTISSLDLLACMKHADARHIGPIPAAITYLQNHLSPGDVLMTLGAGDGYKVGEGVLGSD